MIDLTELRRDYGHWPDVKSRKICGLCDLVEERDRRIAELEAAVPDIVKAAVKYLKAKLIVYGTKSTLEDFDNMSRSESELFELLEDVEIDDA